MATGFARCHPNKRHAAFGMCYGCYERWHGTPEARIARAKKYQDRNRTLIDAAKATGCVDCGERDERCLDLDHVRGTKVKNVSEMLGCSVPRLLEEIAKCEVRCANCHRKRTVERREHR